jgi:predicted RNA binding protein YcfA (HicA-like mRNA interferase family)
MKYPHQVWDQLKNISVDDLIRALEKSGWIRDEETGNIYVYRHPDGRRITIHPHPHKTYGANLLKALLEIIGWSETELKQLKLIKKH